MTTLSHSFIISLLLATIPNAVEEAKLRHSGQEVPEDVRNHPNNKDQCRVRIGQSVFGELVDMLILDMPEAHAAIYDAFGVSDANRDVIAQARTNAAVTPDELRSMRQQVAQIEEKMRIIPRPLWSMILGPKEEIETVIERYNSVGDQLAIISDALVAAPKKAEAEEEEPA